MPFHSAIVLNLRGNVLYSKYFLLDDVDRLNFEQELFSRTFALWSKPLLPLKQTVAIQDKIVLFQRLGDIVLMVVGVEEVDEIIRKCCAVVVLVQNLMNSCCNQLEKSWEPLSKY